MDRPAILSQRFLRNLAFVPSESGNRRPHPPHSLQACPNCPELESQPVLGEGPSSGPPHQASVTGASSPDLSAGFPAFGRRAGSNVQSVCLKREKLRVSRRLS